jgi:AcrR family transcriptional regulator
MNLRKGELTRQNILNCAVGLASQMGLEGLSIGSLASNLKLSKSGLFAHFQSKERLQIMVLDAAAQSFSDSVVRPAVKEERGLPRIRALFENWLGWANTRGPGGCIFVAASAELDDRPGPVRDHLVKLQKEWLNVRIRIAMTGVEQGHFKSDLDCEQFAYDFYGIMLVYHHAARLLKDPKAEKRARRSFESLLSSVTVSN